MYEAYSVKEELAGLERSVAQAEVLGPLQAARERFSCPECGDSGIAVEYDGDERREVWCECRTPVIGRFVCSWCHRILEECEAPGQSDGICPDCLGFLKVER